MRCEQPHESWSFVWLALFKRNQLHATYLFSRFYLNMFVHVISMFSQPKALVQWLPIVKVNLSTLTLASTTFHILFVRDFPPKIFVNDYSYFIDRNNTLWNKILPVARELFWFNVILEILSLKSFDFVKLNSISMATEIKLKAKTLFIALCFL